MSQLRFKPSFDLNKLTWSHPDSRIIPFCSVCSRHIPDNDTPLMMWSPRGACIQLCDECVKQWLEVRS